MEVGLVEPKVHWCVRDDTSPHAWRAHEIYSLFVSIKLNYFSVFLCGKYRTRRTYMKGQNQIMYMHPISMVKYLPGPKIAPNPDCGIWETDARVYNKSRIMGTERTQGMHKEDI